MAARRTDIRALLATLVLSRGVPMLTAGDEFGRTQHGNNNAYAQDNAGFWLDWEAADTELAAFVSTLSRLRREHLLLVSNTFLTGKGDPPDALWLKPDGSPIADHEWGGLDAFCLLLNGAEESLLIAINRGQEAIGVTLPGGDWRRIVSSVEAQDGVLPPRSVQLWSASPDRQ